MSSHPFHGIPELVNRIFKGTFKECNQGDSQSHEPVAGTAFILGILDFDFEFSDWSLELCK